MFPKSDIAKKSNKALQGSFSHSFDACTKCYYLKRNRIKYKCVVIAKLQLISTSSNLTKQCKLNKPDILVTGSFLTS